MIKWGFSWRYDNQGKPHKIGIAFWRNNKKGNLSDYDIYISFPKFLVYKEHR
ncbi:MAG: hypothetical protein PHT02_01045 [Tissierellia bacterium]|nr:hypothetical protein [Tissierellia bacterium]